MPYFVYLLECSNGNTYVGATVDVDKRLRKHNNEISGGAVATTSKVKRGEIWKRICYVKNFPDWSSALQFEWRWKQITRKINSYSSPIERRLDALVELLSLERSTSKAIAFHDWPNMPEVIMER